MWIYFKLGNLSIEAKEMMNTPDKVWPLYCMLIDANKPLGTDDYNELHKRIQALSRTMTREEVVEADTMHQEYKQRNKIEDVKRALVDKLESDIENLCMEFEKISGVHILDIDSGRDGEKIMVWLKFNMYKDSI